MLLCQEQEHSKVSEWKGLVNGQVMKFLNEKFGIK